MEWVGVIMVWMIRVIKIMSKTLTVQIVKIVKGRQDERCDRHS